MAARRRRLQANRCLPSLDCVGILKLRNADIELRKGDLGRRNTRVRVGYRVHVPQPHGNLLCLQTASVPIECCESLRAPGPMALLSTRAPLLPLCRLYQPLCSPSTSPSVAPLEPLCSPSTNPSVAPLPAPLPTPL